MTLSARGVAGNQLYNDGQLEAAEMVYSEAIKARHAPAAPR